MLLPLFLIPVEHKGLNDQSNVFSVRKLSIPSLNTSLITYVYIVELAIMISETMESVELRTTTIRVVAQRKEENMCIFFNSYQCAAIV